MQEIRQTFCDGRSQWVYMFPGQGSQYIGMAKDFYDCDPWFRDTLSIASELAGINLEKLCFRGPISKLTNTRYLQVALTAVNIGIYHYLEQNHAPRVSATLGHSVGQYSALFLSGVLSRVDVLRITAERGRLMQEQATRSQGVMYAVKNSTNQSIQNIIDALEVGDQVVIANDNSPREKIISGSKQAIAGVVLALANQGIEHVKLAVSGAWHSPLMRDAQQPFAQCLESTTFGSCMVPTVCNVTATTINQVGELRESLVDHLVTPVRWVESITVLLKRGHRHFVEIGPKQVLSRLLAAVAHSLDLEKEVTIEHVENMVDAKRFIQEERDP